MAMGSSLVDEAVECVERTLAAASARLHFRHELDFPSFPERTPRRRGGLLGALLRLVRRAGRSGFLLAARRWTPQFRLDGFIEASRRAYIGGSGSWAQLWKDGGRWAGRPGQSLAALEPSRKPPTTFDPLWYLDALRGLTDATALGDDIVRATPCRRLAARVDIARASAAAPAGLHAPAVDRYEDLL